MTHTRQMLETSPRKWPFDLDEVVAAIDACADCLVSCTACADACLSEDDVAELRRCIVLCSDCADVCVATARVLARPSLDDMLMVQRQLEACVRACATCAEECHRHAHHHPHCAVSEESCRECEAACRRLIEAEANEELKSLAGG